MSNFIGDNINAIRIHKGLSQEQLAEAAGVSQTTVSAWECGTSTPRKSNVMRLLDAIPELDFDDVMSEENGFAKTVIGRNLGKRERPAYADMPLYGSIAAGTPIEMLEVDDTFPIPNEMAARYPDAFLLKVEGESMNRKIPNGSYALISPTSEVIDGKAYAVCVNGYDATIKRVQKLANGFMLSPDSVDPTYKPKLYDFGEQGTETITVIGRVVWYCVPFDYDI